MSDSLPGEARLVPAFWDAYFENRFAVLTRSEAGCFGMARTLPSGAPAGLGRELQLHEIACSRAALADYDTVADERFSRLPWRLPRADDALHGMIERTHAYRDAAPFGKVRMAELLTQCRQMQPGQITTEALQQLLIRLVAANDASLDSTVAALAFLLGELRDPTSGPALLSVVSNGAGMPFARRVIHFVAVNTAFSAAWKSDVKSIAPNLLVLMEDADGSARQKIASLFERLYSTHELESLQRHGEAWLTAAFWHTKLAPMLDSARWATIDAASLFWELRLSSVARLGPEDLGLLQLLTGDEVGVVREAAAIRLAQLTDEHRPGRRT